VFGAPAISSPPSLTFGSQTVGQSGPVLWLPVINSGQAPLSFTTAASVSGSNASEFAIPAGDDLCDGASLQLEQTCWIGVQFTPATRGVRSAVLSIGQSNEVFSPTVALSGTGVNANSGPTGPQGSTGATGPAGPAGKNGQIELVKCRAVTVHHKKQIQCTAKLVSGVVKFTTTGAVRASLDRGPVVYATGIAVRSRHGMRLLLTPRRRLRPGRYTLRLAGHQLTSVIIT
jgi:hypothetical protein